MTNPQLHYVVLFDNETGTWRVDWESTTGHFRDEYGEVWDITTAEWLQVTDDGNEDLKAEYEKYGDLLDKHLTTLDLPRIVIAPTLGQDTLGEVAKSEIDEGEES
ncbi:MAG: hypothetical protein EBT15_09945 [Betaproteobacteria bacterium]|nr:hypothetical protein [Betaproteobacteria bacterium]